MQGVICLEYLTQFQIIRNDVGEWMYEMKRKNFSFVEKTVSRKESMFTICQKKFISIKYLQKLLFFETMRQKAKIHHQKFMYKFPLAHIIKNNVRIKLLLPFQHFRYP